MNLGLRFLLTVSTILLCFPASSNADDKSVSDLSFGERYRLAFEFQSKGDYASALPLLISIRDEASDYLGFESSPGLEFDIGNCLIGLERWEEARDAFRRCFLMTASEKRKKEVLKAIGEMPE